MGPPKLDMLNLIESIVNLFMYIGSEKRNCEGGFWTLEFACLWKTQ